jgi:lipopolysaccharide/colanic/teichoic acid biosynthesis glycosyltransferase
VKALAILLDTRPAYLCGHAPASLLLAPLGPTTVLRYAAEQLSGLGSRLTVATAFEPEADYERRLRACGVPVEAVVPARDLAARLADYEPSDWLLMVDPACVPGSGLNPRPLLRESDGGARRVRHLVALETHPGGTTERVHLASDGGVGRIQRYYDAATWPFVSGIACSLLPVSCTLGAPALPFGSLRDLRRALSERGIPSHDVFVRGGAFDLSREQGLLSLSERLTLEHFRGRAIGAGAAGWQVRGPGGDIDPSARLIGPVLVHRGAVVGAGATVVGPAVLGAHARVGRDAVVAQCLLGPEAAVGAGVVLRHRAVFGPVDAAEPVEAAARPYLAAPAPALPSSEEPERWPRAATAYPAVKAALDVAAAAVGLLLLSPLLLLIALLVKLGSRGPVLYRDRREGRGGRAFDCLKFRTMSAGADAQQRELRAANQVDGPQFKMARDPRVTRLGRVLRRLSLDELPQLLNVLRLEMSLVGPRPSPFRENQLCIPWRDGRLSVRPGITGLWQVCRNRRAQGDFHQWIHFDLLYVRHMSFLVDLKILAATLVTLAGQWPVPLPWIVPARRLAGTTPVPLTAEV